MRRRLLPAVLLVATALPAAAGIDPSDAAVALPIELSDPAATEARVEIPPSLFAYVRHGTDDVVVVDAAGEPLPSTVLTRDGEAADARSDLEPRLVSQSASAAGLALLFDLRVRAAPGLVFELELRGPAGTPLHVSDADDPRTGPWEEIPFVASGSGDERLAGRAVVPSGAGRRFVRVVVPTRTPERVRVARAAATIRRHGVCFRPAHGTAPFRLLAGLPEPPASPGPRLSDPVPAWDTGAAAHVPAPAWLPPEPGLGATRSRAPLPGGRPFPWAEWLATLLTLALTIWAVLLRKER